VTYLAESIIVGLERSVTISKMYTTMFSKERTMKCFKRHPVLEKQYMKIDQFDMTLIFDGRFPMSKKTPWHMLVLISN